MRIVSERTEAEIAEARALALLEGALKDLTANLMRIMRGAGKPYEVRKQIAAAHAVYEALAAANPKAPWPNVADGLFIPAPRYDDEMTWARDTIVRGALQVAASNLLNQPMQERAGRDELHSGVRAIEDFREEGRRARAEIERLERAQRRATKAKPTAKKKPKAR